MGMTVTNHPGGATTTKFDSIEELQAWAKKNISNPSVLATVMTPISKPQKKEEIVPGATNETPIAV